VDYLNRSGEKVGLPESQAVTGRFAVKQFIEALPRPCARLPCSIAPRKLAPQRTLYLDVVTAFRKE